MRDGALYRQQLIDTILMTRLFIITGFCIGMRLTKVSYIHIRLQKNKNVVNLLLTVCEKAKTNRSIEKTLSYQNTDGNRNQSDTTPFHIENFLSVKM